MNLHSRSVHGLIGVTAFAIIALFIWRFWHNSVPVAAQLAPSIANTSIMVNNTPAAPDPYDPVTTSWTTDGMTGINTGQTDYYSD